jgi:GDPmannose 4,6-dehydratase
VDEHVRLDETYLRPSEVDTLLGDASKARRELGWTPTVGFDELIEMLVEEDLEQARREKTLKDCGHLIPDTEHVAVH